MSKQVNCVPVMPDPMIHISASRVRAPSLPSVANGFASGAESIQKDFVGLGTGRLAGVWEVGSCTLCTASNWFKGMDDVDIITENQEQSSSRNEMGPRGSSCPRMTLIDSFQNVIWA
jgi:hypothetical protein